MEFHVDRLFLQRPLDGPFGYEAMAVHVFMGDWFLLLNAGIFLWRATQNLEAKRGSEPLRPEPFDAAFEPVPVKRVLYLPEIGDDPLVWRERYLDRQLWVALPAFTLPILMSLVLGCFAALMPFDLPERARVQEEYRHLFAGITLLLFGLYILLVAYRLTGCIVREREQHTLDSLLTLPITSTQLLWAKLVGNLQRSWGWLIPCGVAFLVMAILTGRNPFGAAVLALALMIHLGFFAMLGLSLSVVCRSSVTAYVSLTVILLLLLFGTLAPGELGIAGEQATWIYALNPVGCWLVLAREHWQEGVQPELPANLVGLAIYAALTLVLWMAARFCFARRD